MGLGSMWCIGIKKEIVAGLQDERLVTMSVFDFTFQHIDEFHAVALEVGKGIGLFRQGNQIGFNDSAGRIGPDMAKQVVLMAGARAAPVGFNSSLQQPTR